MRAVVQRWSDVHQLLSREPHGARRTLRLGEVPRPEFEGAVRSTGLGRALRHWRFPADDEGRGLHVLEHADRYVVHLDRVHPDRGLLDHLVVDAPEVVLATGALVGFLLGWRRAGLRAATQGSTIGTLVAALTLPRRRDLRPEAAPGGGVAGARADLT